MSAEGLDCRCGRSGITGKFCTGCGEPISISKVSKAASNDAPVNPWAKSGPAKRLPPAPKEEVTPPTPSPTPSSVSEPAGAPQSPPPPAPKEPEVEVAGSTSASPTTSTKESDELASVKQELEAAKKTIVQLKAEMDSLKARHAKELAAAKSAVSAIPAPGGIPAPAPVPGAAAPPMPGAPPLGGAPSCPVPPPSIKMPTPARRRPAAAGGGDRNALLSAIQSGKRLKKASQRKLASKPATQKGKAGKPTPMNMQAQLAMALSGGVKLRKVGSKPKSTSSPSNSGQPAFLGGIKSGGFKLKKTSSSTSKSPSDDSQARDVLLKEVRLAPTNVVKSKETAPKPNSVGRCSHAGCSCDSFKPFPFKPTKCNNCFHVHS